jgi:HSP20 family molecular chaperone IbpA
MESVDFPTADHPHQRLHQHQTFLRHLTGKGSSPYLNPNYPDLDLTDNVDHYLIEVELPGVKKAEDVKCQWTSSTSLIVYGEISRRTEGEGETKNEPDALMSERRIGTFRRHIHFPISVDMEKMTAKLDAGLLTIKVPKRVDHIPQGSGKVDVEVVP